MFSFCFISYFVVFSIEKYHKKSLSWNSIDKKHTFELYEKTYNKSPKILAKAFENAIKEVQDEIYNRKQEFNAEMARKIAFISSNGDNEIADRIGEIYKELGNDVYIDVEISPTSETYQYFYKLMPPLND